MGPTLSVHLPDLPSRGGIESLHGWLSQNVLDLTRTVDSWEFRFGSQSCLCSLALVPFGTQADGFGQATGGCMEEDEFVEYELLLGHCPRATFQLDNYCRSDLPGHKQLAQLASELARRFSGMIDVGSAIHYLVKQSHLKGEALWPGRVIALNLTHSAGWEVYLVDADFMDGWIESPHFGLEI